MNNKKNLERSMDQNLINLQQQLFFQIQQTYRYFLGELIAGFLFCIMIGIFTLPFVTYGINDFHKILPKVMIALNPSIMSIIQILRIRPYLRATNFYLKKLRFITLNSNMEQSASSQFIHVINSYLNKLHFLIFHKKNLRKGFQKGIYHQLNDYLKKRFNIDLILIVILGIIVFGYSLYLTIEYIFLLLKPIVYLSLLGVIISYCLIFINTLKARQLISHWIEGYFDLKSWADNLEQLPLKNQSNQFNEE